MDTDGAAATGIYDNNVAVHQRLCAPVTGHVDFRAFQLAFVLRGDGLFCLIFYHLIWILL
jgi:hypothetical protein